MSDDRLFDKDIVEQRTQDRLALRWSKPTPITTDTFRRLNSKSRPLDFAPAYEDIPDQFRRLSNSWHAWGSTWFFNGLSRYPVPKPGIDRAVALAHLNVIQRSWNFQHEHKAAAVAYLASLWFESTDGDPIK